MIPTVPPPLRTQRLSVTAFSLGLLAVIAVGMVLKAAQGVVLPLFIAWLLSYLLSPIVHVLVRRWRIPAPVAVAVVLLLFLAATWGIGIVIQQRLLAFAKAFPAYEDKLSALFAYYGSELEIPSTVLNEARWNAQLGPILLKTSRFFFTFISNAVLVMIYLVFMLLAKPYSNDKLRAALPERADTIIAITNTISRQISAYLSALFVISLVTGLMVWGVLEWMEIEFAFTWGLLAFLLNFIPTLGSIVASIPPILMAIVQFYPAVWPVVGVAVVLIVIQQVMGNLVAPKVFGDRLNLSPVVILLFLVFWGWLWGVVGALLAVPIAAAIQIALAHIPPLAPLAVMMGSGKKYAKKPSPPDTDVSSGPT